MKGNKKTYTNLKNNKIYQNMNETQLKIIEPYIFLVVKHYNLQYLTALKLVCVALDLRFPFRTEAGKRVFSSDVYFLKHNNLSKEDWKKEFAKIALKYHEHREDVYKTSMEFIKKLYIKLELIDKRLFKLEQNNPFRKIGPLPENIWKDNSLPLGSDPLIFTQYLGGTRD